MRAAGPLLADRLSHFAGLDYCRRNHISKVTLYRQRRQMVRSPCINVCTVEDGVCTACNRTLEDIANWAGMTDAERKARMGELEAAANST